MNTLTLKMKRALSKDLKKKKTAAICEAMSNFTGSDWNPSRIFNLTKRDRDSALRIDHVPAWVEATGSIELLRVIVEEIPGLRLVSEADALKLELLKKQEEIDAIRRRLDALENSTTKQTKKYKEV